MPGSACRWGPGLGRLGRLGRLGGWAAGRLGGWAGAGAPPCLLQSAVRQPGAQPACLAWRRHLLQGDGNTAVIKALSEAGALLLEEK